MLSLLTLIATVLHALTKTADSLTRMKFLVSILNRSPFLTKKKIKGGRERGLVEM